MENSDITIKSNAFLSEKQLTTKVCMTTEKAMRRHEFDWLRVLAIFVVFLYHSSRFFNFGDWIVKNTETFLWVELWHVFAMSWLMPLFFVISGISLFYAIGKVGGWTKYYVDKFLRLMVPVIIAVVTHSALQVYLERLTHGQYFESFFAFIPEYFNGLYQGIGMQGGNFAFIGIHLWYLLFLFIDSLICYQLFIWFKGRGNGFLVRVANFMAVPIVIYIWFSIPLLILELLIPPAILTIGAGSWGFLYYLWFLIAGFIVISNQRLQQTIKNQRLVSLLLGIVLSVIYLYQSFGASSIGMSDWVTSVIYILSAWCWIFAIIGFGSRFLAFDHPVLPALNEGILPFYILHQPVLVIMGYFFITLEISALLKWLIIFTSSLIIILSLYTILIRKNEPLRFLFGLKTSHNLFLYTRTKTFIGISTILYLGLIVFAITGVSVDRTPMPLTYDPSTDIILNSQSSIIKSSTGVRVVNDKKASIDQALEFTAGANTKVEKFPEVYIEARFSAPSGRYYVWLRGKSDVNDTTDSAWLQVDDRIGTQMGNFCVGNWLDSQPPSIYGWAGSGRDPVVVYLKHDGEHIIRIQPRQIPFQIDQIWLSRSQFRIPDTRQFIETRDA